MANGVLIARPPADCKWARILVRRVVDDYYVEFKTDWHSDDAVRQQRRATFDAIVQIVKAHHATYDQTHKRWLIRGSAAAREILTATCGLGFSYDATGNEHFFLATAPQPHAAGPSVVTNSMSIGAWPSGQGHNNFPVPPSSWQASSVWQGSQPVGVWTASQFSGYQPPAGLNGLPYSQPVSWPCCQPTTSSPAPCTASSSHLPGGHCQSATQVSWRAASQAGSVSANGFVPDHGSGNVLQRDPREYYGASQVIWPAASQASPAIATGFLPAPGLGNVFHQDVRVPISFTPSQPSAGDAIPPQTGMPPAPVLIESSQSRAGADCRTLTSPSAKRRRSERTIAPTMQNEAGPAAEGETRNTTELSDDENMADVLEAVRAAEAAAAAVRARPTAAAEDVEATQAVEDARRPEAIATSEPGTDVNDANRPEVIAAPASAVEETQNPDVAEIANVGEDADASEAVVAAEAPATAPVLGDTSASAAAMEVAQAVDAARASAENEVTGASELAEAEAAEVTTTVGATTEEAEASASAVSMRSDDKVSKREVVPEPDANSTAALPISTGSSMPECTICMDAIVGTVFVPCGHMCACRACGERLAKKPCPVCRKKIKRVQRFFMSV